MNRWLVAMGLILSFALHADDTGSEAGRGYDRGAPGYALRADFPLGGGPARPLNDSGQHRCYDNANAEAPCDPIGFPGQDGRFGRDVAAEDGVLPKLGAGDAGFDFNKISETGDELPEAATEWTCVRDNVTGLTWQLAVQSTNWEDARTTLPAAANAEAVCGFDDWRLPAVAESLGIIHFGVSTPMIDQDYFPGAPGSAQWTGDELATNPNNAWTVNFGSAFMANSLKTFNRDVRLVRGASSSHQYIDHEDGTVTSVDTDLMWSRCSWGQNWDGETCQGEAQPLRWVETLQAVAALNIAGHLGYSDWRLPSIKELASIADYTQPNPAVDPDIFPATPGGRFSSSTTRATATAAVYSVQGNLNGQIGTVNKTAAAGALGLYARPVRGGAPFDDYDRLADAGPLPEITVAPTALEFTLEESDGSDMQMLVIANDGDADLVWNMLMPAITGCYQTNVSWLSLSTGDGMVAAQADQTIEVTVDVSALTPGIYETTLCIHNDDIVQPRVDVPVTLILNEDPLPEQPVLELDPPAISAVIFAGQTAQRMLTLGNLGAHALDWSISFSEQCEPAPPAWLVVTPASGSVPPEQGPATVVVTLDAGTLAAGDYDAVLCLETNDPDQPETLIDLSLGVVTQVIGQPLNDSGQAACYDGGHNITACDVATHPGQDGRFGRDAAAAEGLLPKQGAGAAGFDFTKLSDDGDALPAGAAEWACVRDNTTGLSWAVDVEVSDWDDAMTLLTAAATGDELCGFEDWRLPTPAELLGIIHAAEDGPAVDLDYFPATPSAEHWTETEIADNALRAWVVDFNAGGAGNLRNKTTLQQVRLVRGERASGEYVDHGDGTVTSLDTGLMWSRCMLGQTWDGQGCVGEDSASAWQGMLQGVEAANDSAYLGYDDWRMPNVKELISVVDYSRTMPAADPDVFPDTPEFRTAWASTTAADNTTLGWAMQTTGVVRSFGKTSLATTRPVRAGAPFDAFDRLAPAEPNPVIEVTPATLEFEVALGGTAAAALVIDNSGDAELIWDLLDPPDAGCYHPDDVSWLSVNPDAGAVAAGGDQTIDVSADAAGLVPGTHQTTLCLHSNDNNTPRLDVPATLVVDGDPLPDHAIIDIDPEAFSEVVFAGETAERIMTIGNAGGETLTWSIGFLGAAGMLGSEIIWEQPETGDGGIASVYFDGRPGGDAGIYSANDFVIDWGRQITEIYTPGSWSSQFPGGTVADAISITWAIHANAGGVPAGHPENPADPVWSLTLPADHPAVTIENENITLDVASAAGTGIHLDAGRYWLSVVPQIQYQTSIANRWNWRQGAPAESSGHLIDPQNLFGLGATSWSTFASVGLGWSDVAFTLRGGAAEVECDATAPAWLDITPASGSTVPLDVDAVLVALDSTGLAAGSYDAVLCVESNDPDQPVRLVTVQLNVVLPPTDQPLNDSGQGQCFGVNNNPAVCDPDGFPGQDGRYGRDAAADDGVLPKIGGGVAGFDFTKISNSGDPLPPSAQVGAGPDDWACTRDNTTGLIWAVQTHAASWDDAVATHVPNTNAAQLCGFSDWRLPGTVELQSLVHYGMASQMIDSQFFPQTNQGPGATVNTYFAIEAPCQFAFNRRTVDLNSGTVGCLISTSERRVQLVRGNPVEGELVANDDHTVTDTRTRLVWDRCSLGQTWNGSTCSGTVSAMTWQDALQAVATANDSGHLGHSDWRLPNNKELTSQCDLTRRNPAIDILMFPGTPSAHYWTSTTTVGTTFDKYIVDFLDCRMRGNVSGTATNPVRMVRGGNTFDRYDRLGDPVPEHPVIVLDPDSLSVTLNESATANELLVIGNAGSETLDWAFEDGPGCELPAGISWLSMTPGSGQVAGGNDVNVTAAFSAGALAPGAYSAVLCIASNDPDNALLELPVSLTISDAPEPVTVEGTVTGLGYCDSQTTPLAGAEVMITGAGGSDLLLTNGGGFYQTTVAASDGPLEISVSADEHQPQTITGVELVPGGTVVRHFDLRELLGCTTAAPDTFEVSLPPGDGTTRTLTLTNTGLLNAGFDVASAADWLELEPESGVAGAEGSAQIDVVFTASPAVGTHETVVTVTVDDGQGLFTLEVPVTLNVVEPGSAPEIVVDPNEVSAVVAAGDTVAQDIAIGNTGDALLEWSFTGGSQGNVITGDNVTISHSTSMTIVESNTTACSPDGGFTTADNRFMRVFDLADFGFQHDFGITGVTFGLERLDVDANVEVRLHTLEGALAYANMALIGSASVALQAQTVALVHVPVTASVPADTRLVVEVVAPGLTGTGQFYAGSNGAGERAPSYLAASSCGVAEPALFDEMPVHLVMSVSGHTQGGLPLTCDRPDDVSWLAASPSAGSVQSGGSQPVTFTFDAGDLAEGEYASLLCLASNDPANPVVTVPVTLVVEPAPEPGVLTVAPAVLDFGKLEVGDMQTLTFQVTNTAGAEASSLTLQAPALTGDPEFAVAGDCQAGTILAPQQSCTVEVSFSPDSEGSFAGEVGVTTADGQSETVVLSGTGEILEPPGDEIFGDRFEQTAP